VTTWLGIEYKHVTRLIFPKKRKHKVAFWLGTFGARKENIR
jgi:hypothetical protein